MRANQSKPKQSKQAKHAKQASDTFLNSKYCQNGARINQNGFKIHSKCFQNDAALRSASGSGAFRSRVACVFSKLYESDFLEVHKPGIKLRIPLRRNARDPLADREVDMVWRQPKQGFSKLLAIVIN